MKLTNFFTESYNLSEERSPDPKVVAKFADVDAKHRSYYIMKWAEEKGIDGDDAMELAGYVRDGYIGAGAWNWRYVGLDEDKQRLDPKCWKGYKKQGTKMKGGVRVNNCVKEAKQALARHVKEGVPLPDSLFRYQSDAYFDTFKYAKQLREAGILQELDWESEEMLSTDIGESVELKGVGRVWLDVPYLDESEDTRPCPCCDGGKGACSHGKDVCGTCEGTGKVPADFETEEFPLKEVEAVDQGSTEGEAMVAKMLAKALGDENRWAELSAAELYAELESESPKKADMIALVAKMLYDVKLQEAEYQGKDVELNKPKRGGSKKYYVYVKNPKTGNVKKISFGDPGLKTKSGNKGRAKSFAARHNCEKKNDKTKAGYWACRLPRYGLVKGGKWW